MTRAKAIALFRFLYALTAVTVARTLHAQELHVDAGLASRGQRIWNRRHCADCHTFGKGPLIGPDLRGLLLRRDAEWVRRWLKDTDHMLQTDSVATNLLITFGGVRMPNHGLSDSEVEQVVHFLARAGAIGDK